MTGEASIDEAFCQLRAVMEAEPDVELRLRACLDWPSFTTEAIEIAAAHGFSLSEGDIARARARAQRSWLSRWV